jgi:hypothetical protein
MEEQQEQREGSSAKAWSGNRGGRPRGNRETASPRPQHALDGEAQALTRRAVELVLEENTIPLKLCLDRRLAAPEHSVPPKGNQIVACANGHRGLNSPFHVHWATAGLSRSRELHRPSRQAQCISGQIGALGEGTRAYRWVPVTSRWTGPSRIRRLIQRLASSALSAAVRASAEKKANWP